MSGPPPTPQAQSGLLCVITVVSNAVGVAGAREKASSHSSPGAPAEGGSVSRI